MSESYCELVILHFDDGTTALRRQLNELNELFATIRIQLSEIVRSIDDINVNANTLERFIADERRLAMERHRLEWEENNDGSLLYNLLAEDEID